MRRMTVTAAIVLMVSGCVDVDAPDNQLSRFALQDMYEEMFAICLGVSSKYSHSDATLEQRAACMDAVMP